MDIHIHGKPGRQTVASEIAKTRKALCAVARKKYMQ